MSDIEEVSDDEFIVDKSKKINLSSKSRKYDDDEDDDEDDDDEHYGENDDKDEEADDDYYDEEDDYENESNDDDDNEEFEDDDINTDNKSTAYEEEEEDDDYMINTLRKFDDHVRTNYIENMHRECIQPNYQEINTLSQVIRDANTGNIIDKNHRTLPILTKYERTKILGLRTTELNDGAPAFIKVPPTIIDNYTIAQMELSEKVLPFIIKRPLPNGNVEYWKLEDLQII